MSQSKVLSVLPLAVCERLPDTMYAIFPNGTYDDGCLTIGRTEHEAWERAAGTMFPDKCEVCKGERGGVRGNENIIDDIVICDYCTADLLLLKSEASESRFEGLTVFWVLWILAIIIAVYMLRGGLNP